MSIQFWTNNPTILLNKKYLTELWPLSKMTHEQKLNAISRLIIVTTLLGYLFTQNIKILIAGVISLVIIVILANTNKPKLTNTMLKEGFDNETMDNVDKIVNDMDKIVNPVTMDLLLKSEFKEGTKKNPFSNVLLTDIGDDPERLAAPPAFAPVVEEKITKNIKKSVQFNNPGIKNVDKQLFGDLYENWELDQNSRSYYSTANTKVTNDQGAFSNFLYGQMPSAKESNLMGNLQREKDNLYTGAHYNLY
jgi:hypothetical protein